MKVKIVIDDKAFEDLKEEWLKLQSLGAVKDITLTWEWVSTWWQVFREGRRLCILVISDGEEVVGIAPFIERSIKYFGFLSYERLELIASGEDERDEIRSDYLDFIIKPGEEKAVLEATFEYLHRSGDITWNELLIVRMHGESPAIPIMIELAKRLRLNIEETKRVLCSYAVLPDSLETYIAELGRRTRKQIRRDINRLNELGKLEYKVAGTEGDVELMKEIFIKLHQSRWMGIGMPGVFSSDKFRLFHDKMMATAFRNDWLRLGTLLLDGEPLACEYNFKFRDKIYSYQCGVKTFHDSNISVGTVADVYAIGHAISESLKEYDFLIGATHYKTRLARSQRELVSMRISKPSTRELVYKASRKVRKGAGYCLRPLRFRKAVKSQVVI